MALNDRLIGACFSGDYIGIAHLLASGADPNTVSGRRFGGIGNARPVNYTAILASAEYGCERCVRLLLDANAAVNSENVLLIPAVNGSTDCVELLATCAPAAMVTRASRALRHLSSATHLGGRIAPSQHVLFIHSAPDAQDCTTMGGTLLDFRRSALPGPMTHSDGDLGLPAAVVLTILGMV